MQSVIQVLKLNEPRSGKTATGREWSMQDAECILYNDDGTVGEVGVLMVPKDLQDSLKPGTFMGSFALRANKSKEGGRRIEAVLVALQPYQLKAPAVALPAGSGGKA